MMSNNLIFDKIELIVFDFDGVLTNNMVHLDESGKESVTCSRSDGLAFEALRKLKKPLYILSTEKNPVVSARAKKLKVPVLYGVNEKDEALMELVQRYNYSLKNILYVGNDLNDFKVMQLCGFTACPQDSHVTIKEISNFVLNSDGGKGVVRELLEDIFDIDLVKVLFN
jgi:3-deoxy-D-manno-octulosonate 8-phosphate phosphatase (KDO 8-P phosphatase)